MYAAARAWVASCVLDTELEGVVAATSPVLAEDIDMLDELEQEDGMARKLSRPMKGGRFVARSARTARFVDRPGLDTAAKRATAMRYMDTLSVMNADPVIRERIAQFRDRYAR